MEGDNIKYWTSLFNCYARMMAGLPAKLPNREEVNIVKPKPMPPRAKVREIKPMPELAKTRKKLKLTQVQAAHLLGIGAKKLSRYEQGLDTCDYDIVAKLISSYASFLESQQDELV